MNTNRVRILQFLMTIVGVALPLAVAAATLPNPLGNTQTLEDVIITVTRGLIGLVAFAAVFMFVYAGVMMLTSGGNSEQVQKSKEIFKWSTISIILIFLTAAMLQFLFTTLGSNENVPASQVGLGTRDLQTTAVNIIRVVLGLLGIVGVIMLVYGGYVWLTSAGNDESVEKGKKIIRAAITGLIVILLSWSIVAYVIMTSGTATTTP